MIHRPLLAGLAAALITTHCAIADLAFEVTRVAVLATPADEIVRVVFPFVNEGDAPARITSIRSDCQCLNADVPQGAFEPGAKSSIQAVFKTGVMSGLQEKYLWVTYESGGKETRIALTAAVTIPEVLVLEPATLRWVVGGPMDELTAEMRVAIPEPVRLLEATSSRPEFEIRIEEVEAGRLYRAHIRPKTPIERPLLGLFQLHTDCKYPGRERLMGFLSVDEPPANP